MPVAQRLGWGRTQCDPLLLGEVLPKIHTVGFSITPAQNIWWGTLPSLSHNPTHSQEPKTKLTSKGPTWGGAFCTPHFRPMGKRPQIQKNREVAILGTPILGPSVSLGLFCSFGLLIISGTPGPP